jgi:hypothetical protein
MHTYLIAHFFKYYIFNTKCVSQEYYSIDLKPSIDLYSWVDSMLRKWKLEQSILLNRTLQALSTNTRLRVCYMNFCVKT